MSLLRTKEYQKHAHSNLKCKGYADENNKWDVEREGRSLLHYCFQLGCVGHQKSNVQHALCSTLLIGIVVHVKGYISLQPALWSRLKVKIFQLCIHQVEWTLV